MRPIACLNQGRCEPCSQSTEGALRTTNPTDVQNLIGRTAVDHEGNKIGKVGQVYLDDQTSQPQWVTISTGLFGNKESFAPIAGSSYDGDNLVLAVTKDQVKGAPNLDADGHLLGAEFNAEIQRGHAVETGESTGSDAFAEPRDTRKLDDDTHAQATALAQKQTI
jgi:hypothetical protein